MDVHARSYLAVCGGHRSTCHRATKFCAAYGYTGNAARNLRKDFEVFRHLLIAEESHDICLGEGAEVSVVSQVFRCRKMKQK